jgi:hypothetical protein
MYEYIRECDPNYIRVFVYTPFDIKVKVKLSLCLTNLSITP